VHLRYTRTVLMKILRGRFKWCQGTLCQQIPKASGAHEQWHLCCFQAGDL